MINISRIDHINMRVKSLTQSISFYRTNFGFQMKEDNRTDEEPWVVIGLPGIAYLCLYEHADKDKTDDALTIRHFGFAISDEFDGVIATLEANGATVLYGGPVAWPQSRSIYVEDPSGHMIELSEKVGGGLN